MKIEFLHSPVNTGEINIYEINSFLELIETVEKVCNYENLDRIFILIRDDWYEKQNDFQYEIYDLYINDQLTHIIRQLKMFNDNDCFIKNEDGIISIAIYECPTYEEAYKQALDLMETSHNCYE